MKTIFEWIGKFVLCVVVAVLVRLLATWFGAQETSAAMWSGMVLVASMFETGILKAGFK